MKAPCGGDPDDLLLITGDHLAATDTVVYRQADGPVLPVPPHVDAATRAQPTQGVADLVSAADAPQPALILNVTPAFDVLPDTGSETFISRGHWQNVTVNNLIDLSAPLCAQKNPMHQGGFITWYDTTADSAMAGNTQYATSGIYLNHGFRPDNYPARAILQYYNEVRDAGSWASTPRPAGSRAPAGSRSATRPTPAVTAPARHRSPRSSGWATSSPTPMPRAPAGPS